MPHALITSPSAAARLDRAVAWLRRRRPAERVLLVGASVEAVNELARSAIRRRPGARRRGRDPLRARRESRAHRDRTHRAARGPRRRAVRAIK
ncbi:uncharacterized protein SOCEGT47_002270 [Sorangium cellulosum]|uniref:Uncharacterized protein n=1 Tax=Sorangium cellulosum TaxID=56 RepID=A0A4P2PT24_SORCE|nr:uncharacterized protein SOCEGT47_002270 [Sorangium cellulosum]